VALVRNGVSEDRIARVFLFILVIEAISFSETSVRIRVTRLHIKKDGVLYIPNYLMDYVKSVQSGRQRSHVETQKCADIVQTDSAAEPVSCPIRTAAFFPND
jgi:hypothetical protein